MSPPPTLNDVPALLARIADGLDRIAGLLTETPRGKDSPPSPDAGAATPPAVGSEKAAAASPRRHPRNTFSGEYHAARRDAQRERRLAIARLIRDAGPLGMAAIAGRTATPYGSMSKLMGCDWFEKVGPGLRDPYRLTAAGQATLEAATTAG